MTTIASLPTPGSLPPMTVEQLSGIMHAGVGTIGDVAYVPEECTTCHRAEYWHEHTYHKGDLMTSRHTELLSNLREFHRDFRDGEDETLWSQSAEAIEELEAEKADLTKQLSETTKVISRLDAKIASIELKREALKARIARLKETP